MLDPPAEEFGRTPAGPDEAGTDEAAVYAVAREALARCRAYRTAHGLYGVVEPVLGRIMLEIGAVGAVTMPAVLGVRVRDLIGPGDLIRAGGRTGPVIGHPRSARWTFLTGPAHPPIEDAALLADLFHRGACLAAPGTRIVLPSPADERTGYRIWIDPPEGEVRPDLGTVLAAARHGRPNR
jgi:hypothetical protein